MSILLTLHSFLRWAILVVILIVIFRHLANKGKDFTAQDKSWSLRLLIVTHLQLVIGLIQYFTGNKGIALIKENGMKACMKSPVLRFWVIEHITTSLIAIVLITIAHIITKKAVINNSISKRNTIIGLIVIAFIIMMAAIPWPFREVGKLENIPYFRL
jgi:hypothetical protein